MARPPCGTTAWPSAALTTAAIIAEFDEPEPDHPIYGVFPVVRTIRDGQPLHHRPAAARIDATLADQGSAAHLANALCLTRYRDVATGKERILSTQQLLWCAEDNRPLYLWLRQTTRRGAVSEAAVVTDADLRCLPHSRNGVGAPS